MAKGLDRTTQPLIGYQIPGIASTEAYNQAANNQEQVRRRLTTAIQSINEDIIKTRDDNYITKLNIDTRNKYLELQNEHKLDLEGFTKAAEIWYAETKKVIPNKYQKDLDNYNNEYGGRAYYSIQGNIIDAERTSLTSSIEEERINLQTDRDNDYEINGFSAYIGGDYELKNHELIKKQLDNKLITPNEVPILKHKFKTNTVKQLSMFALRSIIDTEIKKIENQITTENLSFTKQQELMNEVFNKTDAYIEDVKRGKAVSKIKETVKRDFANHPDLEDKLKELDNISAKDSDALANDLETIASDYEKQLKKGFDKAYTTEVNERRVDFFEKQIEKNIFNWYSLRKTFEETKGDMNSKTQRKIENDILGNQKTIDRLQTAERIQNGDIPARLLSNQIDGHLQGVDDVFNNPIYQRDLDGLQLAQAQDFSTAESFGNWYEQGESANNAVKIADFIKNKNGMVPTSVNDYLLTLAAPLNETSYTKAIQLYVAIKNIAGVNADVMITHKMGAHQGLKQGIDADARRLYPKGLHSTPSEDMIKTVVKDRKEIIKNFRGDEYKNLYTAAAGYRKNKGFENEENVFKELGNQNIPQFIEEISKPNGLIPDTIAGFGGKWWRNVFAGDEAKKQMIEQAIGTQSQTLFDKIFNDLDFELDNSVIQMLPNMVDDILVKAKVESFPIPSEPKQFNNWLKTEILDELINVRGLKHSPIHTPFDKRNPQLRDRPLQIGNDKEVFYGAMNYFGGFNNKEFYEAGEMSSTNPLKIIGTAFLGNRLQQQAKNSTMGIDYPDFSGIKNYDIEVMAMSAQVDAITKNLSLNDEKLLNAYNTLQIEFLNPSLQRDEEGNIIPNAQINFLIEQINSRVPKEWGELPTAINPKSWGKYFETNTGQNDILRKMSEGRYFWRQNPDGSTSIITWNFNEDGNLVEENLTDIIEEKTGNQFIPDKNQTIQKRSERYGNMAITENNEEMEKEVEKHSAWMEKGQDLYDEIQMKENQPRRNAAKQGVKNLIKKVIIEQYTASKIKGVEFWTTWRGRRTAEIIGLFNREGILTDDINLFGTIKSKESLEHLIGRDIYNQLGGDKIQHLTKGHLSLKERLINRKVKSDYTIPSITGIEYETPKGKETAKNRRKRTERIKKEYSNALDFDYIP